MHIGARGGMEEEEQRGRPYILYCKPIYLQRTQAAWCALSDNSSPLFPHSGMREMYIRAIPAHINTVNWLNYFETFIHIICGVYLPTQYILNFRTAHIYVKRRFFFTTTVAMGSTFHDTNKNAKSFVDYFYFPFYYSNFIQYFFGINASKYIIILGYQ